MTEDMECHPPQGGRQGIPCIFPILLPLPLKLAFLPWGPGHHGMGTPEGPMALGH